MQLTIRDFAHRDRDLAADKRHFASRGHRSSALGVDEFSRHENNEDE